MGTPRRTLATIKEIKNYGDGVYSVEFSVSTSFTRCKPGQFLHLTLEQLNPSDGYWPESRVFSIASEPHSDSIRIVYSVKGEYTKKMESALAVGNKYWIKLPYGDFIIEKKLESNQPIVLIAGGTGIAPFIPFIIQKGKENSNKNIELYYGVRNKNVLIFINELKLAKEKMNNFNMHLFSEEPTSAGNIKVGHLDIDKIAEETHKMDNPLYFLSGPPVMISLFKEKLVEKGVPDNNIRIDEWE